MLASENSSNILQVIILQRKSVHLQVEKSKYILALELFFSEDRLKKKSMTTPLPGVSTVNRPTDKVLAT